METFNSCILVDDEEQELAEPAMAIDFAECDDDAHGFKLLGRPFFEESVMSSRMPSTSFSWMRTMTSRCASTTAAVFNILMSRPDLDFQNWSHALGYLHSL